MTRPPAAARSGGAPPEQTGILDTDAGQLHIEGVMVGAVIGPATELPFFD